MTRSRRAVAVACIALVVVAAIVPLGGVSLDWAVVPMAFVLLETLTPSGALVGPLGCDAPSIAYFRTIDSRGPPSLPLA